MLQLLKEQLMGYDAFVESIQYLVSQKMGDGYVILIQKVYKNNGMEYDSLVIRKEDRNVAPNVYLMPYYESYLGSTSISEIVERLCLIYEHCSIPALADDYNFTFESIKSYIFYRLVNYEKNERLLEKIPHLRFLDLAITFHCLVRSDEEGIGSIRITNEHLSMWGVSLEEIKPHATENTPRLFPVTIKKIDEVIEGLLDMEYEEEGCYLEDDKESGCSNNGMYVLTNQKGINGAACLLYKDVIKNFANLLKSDLYILPSSIHEVILLPNETTFSLENLLGMVKDVNNTQVAPEEILSYKIYFYSWRENKFSM